MVGYAAIGERAIGEGGNSEVIVAFSPAVISFAPVNNSVRAGKRIEVVNTDFLETGSGSTGQFAIGESGPQTSKPGATIIIKPMLDIIARRRHQSLQIIES